eukprot:170708_1
MQQSRGILSCYGRKIAAYTNSAIVYANLPHRSISVQGCLTVIMCKYLTHNANKSKKSNFKQLFGNIFREIMLKTDHAEICEMEHTFSFKNIIFEPQKQHKNVINYSNKETLIIDKALVLIVAMDQFDDNSHNTQEYGIRNEVTRLKHLWKETYKYEVFVCNEDTLYCTKNDIIEFVDLHKEKLWNSDYKCIMVHILSLGTYHNGDDTFNTSDLKNMPLQFFEHEILEEEFDKNVLIKLIFYNSCRGNNNYHTKETLDLDSKFLINLKSYYKPPISPNGNSITVYGTNKGMEMSDEGEFTRSICDAFENNAKKIMKHDFDTVLYNIKNDLERLTKGEQTCSILHCLAYNEIRFNKSKKELILSKKQHHDQGADYILMESDVDRFKRTLNYPHRQ